MQVICKDKSRYIDYKAIVQELDSTASELEELESAFSFCCPNADSSSKFACLRTVELLHAAKEGRTSIVELLLDAGVPANPTDQQQETALHAAAASNQASTVELLLQFKPNRANSYLCNRAGNTAMHVAAAAGHTSSVQAFLRAGIHPDLTNKQSRSVLALAAAAGHADTAQLLLQHDADPNMQDPRGITALHLAAANGHSAVVEVLLRIGAAVDTANSRGRTALHKAAAGMSEGHAAAVRLLLEQHAPSSVTAVIQALLDRHAETAAADLQRSTPLHIATRNGCMTCLQLLLTAHAEANVADADGRSALHHAVAAGHAAAVSKLLAVGASANAADNQGATVLELACRQGRADIITQLLQATAEVSALGFGGWTSLHVAAYYGHMEPTRLLISHDANLDAKIALQAPPRMLPATANKPNFYMAGCTALHLAVYNGQTGMMQLLLQAGASPHIADNSHLTPLAWAANLAYMPALNCLLLHSAYSTEAAIHDMVSSAKVAAGQRAWLYNVKQVAGAAGSRHSIVRKLLLPAFQRNPVLAHIALSSGDAFFDILSGATVAHVLAEEWLQAEAATKDISKQRTAVQSLIVSMAAAHKQQQAQLVLQQQDLDKQRAQFASQQQVAAAAVAKVQLQLTAQKVGLLESAEKQLSL